MRAESATRNPQSAILTVRDTGTGIPAKELPRLFERFHRVKGRARAQLRRQRHRPGARPGVGQAARRGVRVESEVDRGSAFTVTIPLGKAHLPADRIGAARIARFDGLARRSLCRRGVALAPRRRRGDGATGRRGDWLRGTPSD